MRTLLVLALVAAAAQPDQVFAQSAFSANPEAPELEVPVRRAAAVTKPIVPTPPAPVQSPGPAGNNAVFRANDSFRLSLSGMPSEDALQFSQQPFTIGSDGFFNIPLAGQIRAAGLTHSQLERAIERKLIEEDIFRFPTATIFVDSQARFITVGGAVRNPNRFSWTPDMTLLTAISSAGGGGDFAGDKIELIRGGKKTVFSRKRLEKDPTQDPKLIPGDRLEQR